MRPPISTAVSQTRPSLSFWPTLQAPTSRQVCPLQEGSGICLQDFKGHSDPQECPNSQGPALQPQHLLPTVPDTLKHASQKDLRWHHHPLTSHFTEKETQSKHCGDLPLRSWDVVRQKCPVHKHKPKLEGSKRSQADPGYSRSLSDPESGQAWRRTRPACPCQVSVYVRNPCLRPFWGLCENKNSLLPFSQPLSQCSRLKLGTSQAKSPSIHGMYRQE